MSAAQRNWIHDDSMDQQYVDHWTECNLKARAKLLSDAGRDPFHKYKAWASIPHAVRVDVVTIIKRNLAASTAAIKPRSVPNPNHWYNKD